MIVKGVIDEDFVNYKKASMTIEMPCCNFKCGKEYCQNSPLATQPSIEVSGKSLVKRYINNPITHSVVFAGLDPMDSWEDLWYLICEFRHYTLDDIVIYTGYTEEEVYNKRYIMSNLRQFPNIIIKFGRFIPNQKPHYDEVLGINLISDNQYAKRIS